MKPKVSIIVPVYNVEKYLSQCIDSLLSQTIEDIEIICVNDESPDDSLRIIEGYAKSDTRVVIVNKKNGGVSSARNAGLEKVTGQYFMFVDSDDWLDLNCCETMFQTALKYDADIVMCSYVKEFGSNAVTNHIFEEGFVLHGTEVQNKIRRRLFGPIGKELCRPQDCDILVTPCMQLFKTEKFASVRFEDIKKTGTFEDGLYQIDLYKNCNCFAYIDKPFYHYRKTNESSICTAYKKDLYQKWEYLYDRIDERIKEESISPIYKEALRNRVALGVLPLGLNEAVSDDSINSKSKVLQSILSLPRYEESIQSLDTSMMGLPWKVFFYLCKHKHTTILSFMLSVIQYLRNHQ